jgi:ABC-2 type transport system permease protein
MYALLKKEVASFFNSIIGYLVIIVFLTVVGLYMWVFQGETNVFDTSSATLDTLFSIAPWVFLFLVPAVTMRLFAEEKRTGTLETLLTKPLSDFQIVFAKYCAALLIIILSLLPTLIYFFSIQFFMSAHSVDVGGTIGSYIGLFFLAAIYASIGLWASSITQNQIVAFITAMAVAFFFFIGFQYISSLAFLGKLSVVIDFLGINMHYNSISRGIIDTRDIVYFISIITFFLILTKFSLEKRKY